jgi:hypothetical protein
LKLLDGALINTLQGADCQEIGAENRANVLIVNMLELDASRTRFAAPYLLATAFRMV